MQVRPSDEGLYLCAVLNSATMQAELRPLQSIGAFGPRDIHKYPWFAPVPQFDPSDSLHAELVGLAKDAELVSELTDIEGVDFKRGRRIIRSAIVEVGIAEKVEVAVSQLLDLPPPEPFEPLDEELD